MKGVNTKVGLDHLCPDNVSGYRSQFKSRCKKGQNNDTKPEAYLVNVVCLQQHLPQQTEEQRR